MNELDLTNSDTWEKTTEKCICPKCQKECIKQEVEDSADLFENEGSCLECLSVDQLAELQFVLAVKIELMCLARNKKDD